MDTRYEDHHPSGVTLGGEQVDEIVAFDPRPESFLKIILQSRRDRPLGGDKSFRRIEDDTHRVITNTLVQLKQVLALRDNTQRGRV